ncbi:MAG: hypothetical protein VKJ24_13170 [Synechococcales bacterium]|nr:hypothetical protein [Synechococcales bacterium]
MKTRLLKNTIASLTVFTAIALLALPSLAGIQYTSKDSNLTVQYGSKCSTTKPSGTYRVRNGVTGNLTALDCSGIGGDIADHKFEDTSGKERCYGQMRQVWSRKVFTIWTIEGAIPGHPCSQAGKTFTFEMDSGKQI